MPVVGIWGAGVMSARWKKRSWSGWYGSLLLVAWLLFMPLASVAGANVVPLTPGLRTLDVGPYAQIFEDRARDLTLAQVRAVQGFRPLSVGLSQYSLHDSVWWVRFDVENRDSVPRRWALVIGYSEWSERDAWLVAADGTARAMPDLAMARGPNAFPYRRPVYLLTLQPQTRYAVYLRLRSPHRLLIPLSLWRPADLAERKGREYLWHGMFFGGLLVLLAYNLFLYFALRSRSYLYLSLAIAAFLFELATEQGFLYQWLHIAQLPPLLRAMPAHAAIVGSLLFVGYSLDAARRAPRSYRWINGIALAAVIQCGISPWLPSNALPAFLLGSLSLVPIFSAVVESTRRSHPPLRSLLLAIGVFVIGLIPFLSWGLGLLPPQWPIREIFQVDILLTLVLFSLTQAAHLHRLRRSLEKANRALRLSQDVLEERVAERTRELRKARDAALAADRAKLQFLANMSHEICTPLNAIVGFAQLLQAEELRPRQQDCVQGIRLASQNLLDLVRDVLDVSRIEFGKMTLRQEEFSLYTLLQEV